MTKNIKQIEAFEDKIENLESKVHTTTTMAPKSATKSMTSYKGFCMKRMIDVNDTVKEHTGKTLALKQIEHLVAIRDKLMEQEDRMTQSYEQFTVDEHEEIDTATVIYEETAALIKSALS